MSTACFSTGPQDLLWVDKYRPLSTKNIIGQQGERSNAKKLAHWLQNWEKNYRGGEGGGAKKPPWGRNGARDDGSSYKAALLSGPPGIGKTTTATLVCKVRVTDTHTHTRTHTHTHTHTHNMSIQENGYTFVELNASSTRNKRTLHEEVASQVSCLSIDALVRGGVSSGRRHALIMDEVDGMAGTEDRGGMQVW